MVCRIGFLGGKEKKMICETVEARGGAHWRRCLAVLVLFVICAGFGEAGEMGALRGHILETRGEPLTEMDVRTVLCVTDFGAVPDNGENDYDGIVAVLEAATRSPAPVLIQFPRGTYHVASSIEPLSYNDGALHLIGMRDLILEGNGSEIIVNRSHMSFVYAKNCTNIIIRNFTVDYDPLPFTQGTIRQTDTETGSFVLELDEGYPDPSEPPFTSHAFAAFYPASWGTVMDPAGTGRLKEGVPDHFRVGERERLGKGRVRFFLENPRNAAVLEKGDRFVLNLRAGAVARAFDTENITLQNITAHAIPGCYVQGANLSRVNVLGCRAQLKGDRLIVAGADGIHIQSGRVGPWVEDCDFEGLLDDYVNIYNIPNYILDQPEADRVKVSLQERIREGDRLLFFNPREGRVIQTVTALSVDEGGVRLSEPVEGLKIQPADGTVFKPPVGSGADHGWKEMDHIYNLETSCDYFVFRNNYFHDGRRHGLAIKASYGLVESNRIERLSGSALAIYNLANHPEGFWSRNLVIAGNRIEECGDDSTYLIPIRILGFRWGWEPLSFDFHQNIFFVDNHVSGPRLPLVELASIQGMDVRGNRFISGASQGAFITVSGSESIRFSDNCYAADGGAQEREAEQSIQIAPDSRDMQVR